MADNKRYRFTQKAGFYCMYDNCVSYISLMVKECKKMPKGYDEYQEACGPCKCRLIIELNGNQANQNLKNRI